MISYIKITKKIPNMQIFCTLGIVKLRCIKLSDSDF